MSSYAPDTTRYPLGHNIPSAHTGKQLTLAQTCSKQYRITTSNHQATDHNTLPYQLQVTCPGIWPRDCALPEPNPFQLRYNLDQLLRQTSYSDTYKIKQTKENLYRENKTIRLNSTNTAWMRTSNTTKHRLAKRSHTRKRSGVIGNENFEKFRKPIGTFLHYPPSHHY